MHERIARGVYKVQSFSNKSKVYVVNLNIGTCNCPDFVYRGNSCKHLREMEEVSEREAKRKAEDMSISQIREHLQRANLRPEILRGLRSALYQKIREVTL